jgi:hypothetical protein
MTDEQLIKKYGAAPQLIEDGEYELFLEDEVMTLRHLMDLNRAGYIYNSHLEEVDFEDELEDGTPYVSYMDIYYFTKIERQ